MFWGFGRLLAPATLFLAVSVLPACVNEEIANPDGRAKEDAAFASSARLTVESYGAVGRSLHDEAVRLTQLMEKAIEDFIKAPSPELLDNAKKAWRTARDAYSRAEALRFTGGPFEQDEALAKRVEIAPVDVTLLEGTTLEAGGILDALMSAPDVTEATVLDAVRTSGKDDIRLGWHAIEGLLYGAAVTSGGPPRPHTDFVNDGPASRNFRRGRLVSKTARILILDLEIVANQWDPERTNSFAKKTVTGSLDKAFARLIGGLSDFARKEIAERKLGGVLSGAAEISDASDSTRSDLIENTKGIETVLLANDGRVSGASFLDLLRKDDSARADRLSSAVANAKTKAEACPPLGEVSKGDAAKRAAVEQARDAQINLANALDDVREYYGVTGVSLAVAAQ